MISVKILKNEGFESLIVGGIYNAQKLNYAHFKYKIYDGDGVYYFLPADYCEEI